MHGSPASLSLITIPGLCLLLGGSGACGSSCGGDAADDPRAAAATTLPAPWGEMALPVGEAVPVETTASALSLRYPSGEVREIVHRFETALAEQGWSMAATGEEQERMRRELAARLPGVDAETEPTSPVPPPIRVDLERNGQRLSVLATELAGDPHVFLVLQQGGIFAEP